MKKLFSVFTVALYFTMTCGVLINQHYCMGRFQSFNLYSVDKHECSNCGMPMDQSQGCCKNEVKIVKVQNDQDVSSISFSIKKIEAPVMFTSEFFTSPISLSSEFVKQADPVPPDLSDQDTYLKNSVFRI